MANYTYDDFTRAADAAGLSGSFDETDLTTAQRYPEYGLSLVSLKRDLGEAQTAEQQLLVNEAINQLRKSYGSYGLGAAGSRSYAASYGSKISDALNQIGSYGDFAYSREGDYKDLLDRVISQPSFSYDYESDPIYSSYKKAYNREGDRAAANALAAAAAATGGRPSSYANVAAQQAGNYYAGKLADAIPTLRAQALSEYNDQYAQLLQQLNALSGERSDEYQQYLDRYSRAQQNLQNLQAQDESDYNRYLDLINEEYQRERAAAQDKQNEFENALAIYNATGVVTGALKDILGDWTPAASVYYGGSSGSRSGGTSSSSSGASTPSAEVSRQVQNDIKSIYNTQGYAAATTAVTAAANAGLISNSTKNDLLKTYAGKTRTTGKYVGGTNTDRI